MAGPLMAAMIGFSTVDQRLHELGERTGRRLLLIALERLVGEPGDTAVGAAREPLGVAAGAEALAGAGQDDGADVVA